MPVLGALLLIVQVAFAIHAVRTGRNQWIYMIIFVPGIGCLVYFFTQVLPELSQNRTARRAGNSLVRAVDPQRELRRRKDELELADTVENRVRLADECVEADLFDDAVSLYESGLTGLHEHDPDIMLKMAGAHFLAGRPAETRKILDALIEANPEFKSADGHLLYARSLEALGEFQRACDEYEILRTSYPGEEARARYALMLHQAGLGGRAAELFQEVLTRARLAPKHYRRKEGEWIRIAETHARGM